MRKMFRIKSLKFGTRRLAFSLSLYSGLILYVHTNIFRTITDAFEILAVNIKDQILLHQVLTFIHLF
jgi:hypothetical protein